MIRQREVLIQPTQHKEKVKPRIISWHGVKMMRKHSFLSTVQEIVDFNSTIHVCRIGLIGDMHSGKSTLAEAIAHGVHIKAKEKYNIDYTVRIFTKKELLHFRETISKLNPTNYVLIFDDVSFLGAEANRKAIELIKQAVTDIRHMEGGRDVKIITILNYHYTKGLDKYLRGANFRFFTTIGSEETDNMEKILGTSNTSLVKLFKRVWHQGVTRNRFSFAIGNKEGFTYKYRVPFIPVIFYNEQSPRLVVTPTRTFIDKICTICSHAKQEEGEIPIDKYVEECCTKFAPNTFKLGVKQVMKEQGMNTYGKELTRCVQYIHKTLESKVVDLEKLATFLELTITKTRLDKKVEGILVS